MAGLARVEAAEVAALLQEITGWRRRRHRGRRMPESLWVGSTDLAVKYGASRIAQALGLNYRRLLERTRKAKDARAAEKATLGSPAFIELGGAKLACPIPSGETVVEFVDRDGARMVVRQGPGGKGLDLGELMALFWRRRS